MQRHAGPTSTQERDRRAERRIRVTMDGLERTGDLLLLNVLWIVSCLGVVTVFAATAAMAGAAWAWSRGDDRAPLAAFRHTFRQIGWPSTVVGLAGALAAAVLAFDAVVVMHMAPPLRQVLLVGLASLAALLGAVSLWLTPVVMAGSHGAAAWRAAFRCAAARPLTTAAGLALAAAAVTVLLAAPILMLVIPAVAAFAWAKLTSSASVASSPA